MEELFSVVVITFNQENLILESLDSTLDQGYSSVEIIICDDGSQDGTGDACRLWLGKNRSAFQRAVYFRNEKNLGIRENKMKGIGLARGEYVKPLAGDDVLAPNALMHAALLFRSRKTKILIGNVMPFKTGQKPDPSKREPNGTTKQLLSLDASEQFRIISSSVSIPAPGSFFRRSLFHDLSMPHLHVRQIENWPVWLQSTSQEINIEYGDFDAVFYRLNSASSKNRGFNKDCLRDIMEITDKIIWPKRDSLSGTERAAVIVNRKKNYCLLHGQPGIASIFNTFLTVLKFLVRFKLYRKRVFSFFQK